MNPRSPSLEPPSAADASARYRRLLVICRLESLIGIPLLICLIVVCVVTPIFAPVVVGIAWLLYLGPTRLLYRALRSSARDCLAHGSCPHCTQPVAHDRSIGSVCSTCRRVFLASGERSRQTERELAAGTWKSPVG